MKKSKQRRKSNRRGRSIATTLRAIILEGTGIIALILLISMVRSGNATPVEPLREQVAITDLKNWLGKFGTSEKPTKNEAPAPHSDFGQGFSYARGKEVEQDQNDQSRDWNRKSFPVKRADYHSFGR